MRKESLLWTSFRKRSQWRSAIHAVRLQASLEVARCLIEEMGLDINAIDSHGATVALCRQGSRFGSCATVEYGEGS